MRRAEAVTISKNCPNTGVSLNYCGCPRHPRKRKFEPLNQVTPLHFGETGLQARITLDGRLIIHGEYVWKHEVRALQEWLGWALGKKEGNS